MKSQTLAPVVFLMGPTASGKTGFAIELVKSYPFEIISVDSAQVYQEMNIGTAKPTTAELALAPHRLVDILKPDEIYSVARFREDALNEINAVYNQGKIPLLVGGTMLYFRALQYGLSDLPQANQTIRQELLSQAQEKGWDYMHQQLSKVDAEAARRIHPNDPQRIQRALEVYRLTGETISRLQKREKQNIFPYSVLKFVLDPWSRDERNNRITQRFDLMLDQGFEREVSDLVKKYQLTLDIPSMRTVGYRQMLLYIQGLLNYEQMRQKAIQATKQLAKRQITCLNKEENAFWLNNCNINEITSHLHSHIEELQ